jgi:hypothetical protein
MQCTFSERAATHPHLPPAAALRACRSAVRPRGSSPPARRTPLAAATCPAPAAAPSHFWTFCHSTKLDHAGESGEPPDRLCSGVTKVSHEGSDRPHWSYKSDTQGVRKAALVLQKCHTRGQKGCNGVTKVSHEGSERLQWCYRSVARGVRIEEGNVLDTTNPPEDS